MEVRPQMLIIAGPNGAGKSTCAARFVPRTVRIRQRGQHRQRLDGGGFTEPGPPGVTAVTQLGRIGRSAKDFALETKLANRTLATRIPRWRDAGYRLAVLHLDTERRPGRGAGGPARAERWPRHSRSDHPAALRGGLRLFEVYQPLVDVWRLYDNSGTAGPLLIAHRVHAEPKTGQRMAGCSAASRQLLMGESEVE